MIQLLPVNINSFECYSVAFIFLFPTKPSFLSCLALCSSCKPFLGLAHCPIMAAKTWLLFCSFSPHRFTSLVNLLLPCLASCPSKIGCIQLRRCLTCKAQFVERCGLHNTHGRWKVVIDGCSKKINFFFSTSRSMFLLCCLYWSIYHWDKEEVEIRNCSGKLTLAGHRWLVTNTFLHEHLELTNSDS